MTNLLPIENMIRSRFQKVLDRIEHAAVAANRSPREVKLIVVTKAHPPDVVQAVIEAGATYLGENYAEEGVEKIQFLRSHRILLDKISWHMIGHVQSRKAALIPQHFALLHSLDSVKLAHRLNRFAGDRNIRMPVLLQLNVSGEETKFGIPAWDDAHKNSLTEIIPQIMSCTNLKVQGLMTIPPLFDDPESTRPYFRKLRILRDYLAPKFPHASWEELSMGMSDDFEIAIQEGSTMVRIGTAILGPRP